jgi:cytochrome oxidase assembly protein ShyY1
MTRTKHSPMHRTKLILIIVLSFAAFVGLITWQMSSLRQNRVEVCMAFQGRQNCSTASGTTKEEALRTATDAACTLIAGGVTDTMACTRGNPLSVKWLD